MIFSKYTSATRTGKLTHVRGRSDTNCIHLEFNLRSDKSPTAETRDAILKEKIIHTVSNVNIQQTTKDKLIQDLNDLLFPHEQPSTYYETWVNAPNRKYEDILNNLPHEEVTITKKGDQHLRIIFDSGICIDIKNPDSRTPQTEITGAPSRSGPTEPKAP